MCTYLIRGFIYKSVPAEVYPAFSGALIFHERRRRRRRRRANRFLATLSRRMQPRIMQQAPAFFVPSRRGVIT